MKSMQQPSHLPQYNLLRSHRSRWLFAVYAGSVTFSLFLTICYLASLPFYYEFLTESCYSSANECSDIMMSVIPGQWSGDLALIHVGIDVFIFICYAFVAVLILLLKPMDVIGSIAAFTLVAFVFGDLIFKKWGGVEFLVPVTQYASMAGLMCFALLFPSGKLTRKWLAWTAGIALIVRNVPNYLPISTIHLDKWPLWLSLVWLIVFYGTIAYSQLTQYRENATSQYRLAIRKVTYGFVAACVALICVNLLLLVWPSLYMSDVYWLDLAIRLIMLIIPFSLGSALLKNRLWGVPPVVSSTFVYAALLIALFGIYIATVTYLALVFQSESGVFPLIATGVVAVLFTPLKAVLEKTINRIVYGKRGNPLSFLVGLGDRLTEPFAPEQVLRTVVTTVKEMMQLPYATVTILVNGRETEAAVSGVPNEMPLIRFPLIMGGEELGSLNISPRSSDNPLTDADLKLLHMLIRESARIVHSLKQSLDISRLMQELQASREKLIFTREEELRVIRNNLHDDLAPRLASLALSASAAGEFIRKDPQRATNIVLELEVDIRTIVTEIREFVHNLRPTALDQYGLVEAIRQRADRLMYVQTVHRSNDIERVDIQVASPESLPELPAAVEVAAYRIVSEALVNAVKHSKAGICRVTLDVQVGPQYEVLFVEIIDDGVGFSSSDSQMSSRHSNGVGLTSIRERAEELGGLSKIEPIKGGGIRIAAWLPLHKNADWSEVE